MALADLLRAIVRHRKPQGVHITVVSKLDGAEIARSVATHQLRTQRRNGGLR